jgi:exodeoxyribonuclease VII small subunit
VAKKDTGFDFEKSLAELEAIVAQMESGELSLEAALKQFERGVTLTKACQRALAEAEQRVRILLERNGEQRLEPFEPDDPDPDESD